MELLQDSFNKNNGAFQGNLLDSLPEFYIFLFRTNPMEASVSPGLPTRNVFPFSSLPVGRVPASIWRTQQLP